ncbi:hypothetical protein, partial [Cloacibacillus sp.]|uniref:hypothetical protein n=1 Tax=Cloacibacillus sp. TaxID=2049023 RepID=UPI0025C0D3D6
QAQNDQAQNGQALTNMEAVREVLKKSDDKGPSHWGVKINNAENDVAKTVIDNDYSFLQNQLGAAIIKADGRPEQSIASIADLVYVRGKDLISISTGNSVDYADVRHIIRAGDKGATISLNKQLWLGYVPNDGKVKLGTVTGVYPKKADTVTNDADEANANGANADEANADKELSGLITDKDKAVLQFKDTSSIKIADNSAKINIKGGSTLEMTKDKSTLKARTVEFGVILPENNTSVKINVDSSGVKICDVLFNKSNLSTNGVLKLEGNIIKIG